MALSIAYFTNTDRASVKIYEKLIGSVEYTVTGSSASCGAIPNTAALARLKAGELCYVTNNDAAASSTNGIKLDVGDIIDIQIIDGKPLRAITG